MSGTLNLFFFFGGFNLARDGCSSSVVFYYSSSNLAKSTRILGVLDLLGSRFSGSTQGSGVGYIVTGSGGPFFWKEVKLAILSFLAFSVFFFASAFSSARLFA